MAAVARVGTWDLGEPDDPAALWIDRGGEPRAYVAPRQAGLRTYQPDGPTTRRPPYPGAMMATVVLGADGATLLIDGARVAANGDVSLPVPRGRGDTVEGFFAPMVFSALIDGTSVPPTEVLVEFYQGVAGAEPTRLEHASITPAHDVAAEADCHLLPYPVRQVQSLVSIAWTESARDNLRWQDRVMGLDPNSTRVESARDIGYVSEALPHLRRLLTDMASTPPANPGQPRRAASRNLKGMTSEGAALLAFLRQGYGADNAGTDLASGDFGDNKRLLPREGVQPGDDDPTPFETLRFFPTVIDAYIQVTVYRGTAAPTSWRLRSPVGNRSINAAFQTERARFGAYFGAGGTILAAYRRAEVAPGGLVDDIGNAPDNASVETQLAFLANRVSQEMGGNAVLAVDDTDGGVLRVWGPALVRRPTTQDPLPREAEEDPAEREARAAMRDAHRYLASDYDHMQRQNGSPLRMISWHTGGVPAGAALVDPLDIDDDERARRVPPVPQRALRRDCFRASGLPPLAVQTALGAFLPPDALTESEVRARVGPDKAADVLTKLGLRHTPEAMAALVAFGDLVVHECMRDGGRGAEDPIDSAVRRAQRHARHAARLVRSMYAAQERSERYFLREGDPLFVTGLGGRAAFVCVRHLACWTMAQARAAAVDADYNRPLWSRACRASASAFTEALGRLAKLDKLTVHPVAIPFVPLQSLWTWPAQVVRSTVPSTPLVDVQRLQAITDATRLAPTSNRAIDAQVHAARQSVARVARVLRELGVGAADVAAALAAVVAARPTVERAARARDLALDDAAVDAVLAATYAAAAPKPATVAIDTLGRAWARRAVDTYRRWRHGDVENVPDVVGALAALSLQPDDEQRFFAPFGSSVGASALSGTNPGISEARVWTRAMAWPPAGATAGRTTTLRLRRCVAYDGVLSDERVAHVHPHVLTLRPGPDEIDVPVCLGSARAAEATPVDRVRRLMFTAERLNLALQCAAVHGASSVAIDATDPAGPLDNAQREELVRALPLAYGLLQNTLSDPPALRLDPVTEARPTVRTLRALAIALGEGSPPVLPVLPLCEAATALASL